MPTDDTTNNHSLPADLASTVLQEFSTIKGFKQLDLPSLLDYDLSQRIDSLNATARVATSAVPQTTFEISTIPKSGIRIERAGQYYFSDDLKWHPDTASVAIQIGVSGVELDMRGYTLELLRKDDDNSETDFIGISADIEVSGGLVVASLSICNGTLKNMGSYGVRCTGFASLRLENVTVDTMRYINTDTPYKTPCGLFVSRSTNIAILNCTVRDMRVTSASCAGIQIIGSAGATVENCKVHRLENRDGAAQGYSYIASVDIKTKSCKSDDIRTHYLGITKTTGHTVLGYCPIFCMNLVYDDCEATNLIGCCDDAHGMSVFIDIRVKVTNFRAYNVQDGICESQTGAKATGLEVYGVDVHVSDCKVENILAVHPQDKQAAGFSAAGANITFERCEANKVEATTPRGGETCYGVGFGWAPDPRPEFNTWPAYQTRNIDCTAYKCQVGFDTWCHTDSKWENYKAVECNIAVLNPPLDAMRVLSMDKCSESPTGENISVTLANFAVDNHFSPPLP